MEGNEQTPLLRAHPLEEPREEGDFVAQKPPITLIIYGSFMGIFIAAADESFLLSTWSMIASEFNSLSWGSWLLVTYNLGYCISLPIYGVLCGSFGRRNVILGAYFLFAIGCLICGTSTSYAQLVVGRFIAGVSGGGMVSLVSIIITDVAPPDDVAVFRGYANVINASARSLGAPLGGLLIDSIGWRWSFFGHVPFVIICILVAARGIPPDSGIIQSESESSSDSTGPSDPKPSEFDTMGLISFIIAMLLLFTTLQDLGSETHSSRLAALIPATITAVLTFVIVEAYWAKRPLITIDLFRTPAAVYLINQVLLTFCHSALLSNFVPYVIRVKNTSNVFATSALIVSASGVSVGSLLAGSIIKRTKQYKTLTVIAICGLSTAYFNMLVHWRTSFSSWELVFLFPSGLFVGVLFLTQFTAMSLIVPKERLAVCITTYYFFQQLGTILGPATTVAIVQNSFKEGLQKSLRGLPEGRFIRQILNDERFAWMLSSDVQHLVQQSYRHAFQFAPCEWNTETPYDYSANFTVISMVCSLVMLPGVSWLKEKEMM